MTRQRHAALAAVALPAVCPSWCTDHSVIGWSATETITCHTSDPQRVEIVLADPAMDVTTTDRVTVTLRRFDHSGSGPTPVEIHMDTAQGVTTPMTADQALAVAAALMAAASKVGGAL